jgi:hypothetical protein
MGGLSGAPHSPQNFAIEAFSAPHWEQPRVSEFPHSEQNFLPTEFSNPQLEQRIGIKSESLKETLLVSRWVAGRRCTKATTASSCD